jgi:hypothetical protein
VQFQLRSAYVLLDEADLAAPCILAGIPRLTGLAGEELANKEQQIAKVWR